MSGQCFWATRHFSVRYQRKAGNTNQNNEYDDWKVEHHESSFNKFIRKLLCFFFLEKLHVIPVMEMKASQKISDLSRKMNYTAFAQGDLISS